MTEHSTQPDHPPVIVLGYAETLAVLEMPSRPRIGAILSIHGQREYAVESDAIPRRLVMRFDDVEARPECDRVAEWQHANRIKRAREFGLDPQPPTREHASEIIRFARSIETIDGALLCQCHAGVSRSSAAALLALATWTGVGYADYCVVTLQRVRAHAMPHADIIRFGDELLEFGGTLIQAAANAGWA